LTRRNARFRAADDTEGALFDRFAANDLFRADWYVKIPIAADVDARESRPNHAQNVEGVTVERDGLAHHIGAAAVLPLPESVTEHGSSGTAPPIVGHGEGPADHGVQSKRVEKLT
jgi:hypothetical protein